MRCRRGRAEGCGHADAASGRRRRWKGSIALLRSLIPDVMTWRPCSRGSARAGGETDAPCDADAVEQKDADTPTLRVEEEGRRRWKKSIALLRFFPRPDVTRHPPTRRPSRRGDGRRRSTALRDADAERERGGSAALMRSCAVALLCLVCGGRTRGSSRATRRSAGARGRRATIRTRSGPAGGSTLRAPTRLVRLPSYEQQEPSFLIKTD